MRYTVRVAREDRIDNVLHTDEESEAFKKERELRKIYGNDKVWTVDAIIEFLVG